MQQNLHCIYRSLGLHVNIMYSQNLKAECIIKQINMTAPGTITAQQRGARPLLSKHTSEKLNEKCIRGTEFSRARRLEPMWRKENVEEEGDCISVSVVVSMSSGGKKIIEGVFLKHTACYQESLSTAPQLDF